MKGVIFDLDGTVADTLVAIAHAGNLMLEHFGLEKREINEYAYFAGDGPDVLVTRVLEAANATDFVDYQDAFDTYKKYSDRYPDYQVSVFDGMISLFEILIEKGYVLGVLTNKNHQRANYLLESLGIASYFKFIWGYGAHFPKKPDPMGAIRMGQELNLDMATSFFVGDTNVDIKTGKGAGMKTVGVLWGFRTKEELVEHGADIIIEHPMDMVSYL